MTYITRAEWGAAGATPGPGRLVVGRVEGMVLHWPGMATTRRGVEQVSRALRAWQRYHMVDKGWSDIAYQEAIDQDGNVYELRGLTTQSGANGNQDLNRRFGAILLVLGPGEMPTPAMMNAARKRIAAHRALFENSRSVLPHSTVRPTGTQCPGDVVRTLIAAGAFEPLKRTRGKRVDKALRKLKKSKGKGARREQLDAAVAAVKAIERIG